MRRVAVALVLIALAGCSADPPPRVPDAEKSVATPPPAGTVRYFVGGDSRDDGANVVPWAFSEAKARGASAFIFLGDMELTGSMDGHFLDRLEALDPVPFVPIIGNHELKTMGVVRLTPLETLGLRDPEKRFRTHFLGTKRTPATTTFTDKVVYSVDLEGGLHVIAMDNVSQKGFGKDQLDWVDADLRAARQNAKTKLVVACMHKAPARNGVTEHAMDEDGEVAVRDSDEALALFRKHGVGVIFASHSHRYAKLTAGGIETYITGGLGAPLVKGAFHHLLQLDLSPNGHVVSVVRFEGPQSVSSFAEKGSLVEPEDPDKLAPR